MQYLFEILLGIVAVFHFYFYVLERYIFTTPKGQKIFGLSEQQAKDAAVLAANQGIYNLGLAIGLLACYFIPEESAFAIRAFILAFIVGVGSYGAMTVTKKILILQVIPAFLALVLMLQLS